MISIIIYNNMNLYFLVWISYRKELFFEKDPILLVKTGLYVQISFYLS